MQAVFDCCVERSASIHRVFPDNDLSYVEQFIGVTPLNRLELNGLIGSFRPCLRSSALVLINTQMIDQDDRALAGMAIDSLSIVTSELTLALSA